MQSFSPFTSDRRPRLLVIELWGVGDVALAVPFLQTAARHCRVTLLAKPHAEPLVRRFCPELELIPFTAPWTAFRGKYQLHRWPWSELTSLIGGLSHRHFAAAVSARPDPRDHLLMALAGLPVRAGFPRAGSTLLLTDRLVPPLRPHRADYWSALAGHFDWKIKSIENRESKIKNHIVIHTGAAQPTRQWGLERFEKIAAQLRAANWQVTMLDEKSGDLDQLLQTLATADRFLGNDSGPGHLAALLGVPTFTVFGAQLSENFSPLHPKAEWIEGAPCLHKPCNDYCHFAEPHCIRSITETEVWTRVASWLQTIGQSPSTDR